MSTPAGWFRYRCPQCGDSVSFPDEQRPAPFCQNREHGAVRMEEDR